MDFDVLILQSITFGMVRYKIQSFKIKCWTTQSVVPILDHFSVKNNNLDHFTIINSFLN